jgi:hypothetical protein
LTPEVRAAEIPVLSVEQMREVDRIMVEDLGIELVQMMENAGRALASRARAMLCGDAEGQQVTVLAGPGGNGAGGMVAARRLAIWGTDVTVVLSQRGELLTGVPAQLSILRRVGVPTLATGARLPTLTCSSTPSSATASAALPGPRSPRSSVPPTPQERRSSPWMSRPASTVTGGRRTTRASRRRAP